MDRIFLPPESFADGRAVVTGSERRHLDVLRVQAGERFAATDGRGGRYVLEAERITRSELEARIVVEERRPPGAGARLTLAIAPPKGSRMETAVEKTVECGVGRIVPMRTGRSVVKSRDDSARVERWHRVARSAVAQSGRCWLPEITGVRTLAEALQEASEGTMLLAHPTLNAGSIPTVLDRAARGTDPDGRVTIFIGPEGGFSDEELDEGRRAGAVPVSLGPTRLRSETAAIVAVTLAMASLAGAAEHRT